MARENTVVPAQTLRTLAREALDAAREAREDGREHRAISIEKKAGEALSSLEGKNGEFVAFNGSSLSTLTSEAMDMRHRSAARVYLEKYGVWA